MLKKRKQLFIFGSTGDLVKRKVVPALSSLNNFDLKVITLGRKDFSSEGYRLYVCDGKCSDSFENKHNYELINFEDEEICRNCRLHLSKKDVNYFYSALPPKNIESVVKYVGKLKRNGYKVSLLLEKPFGSSLKEAIFLKKLIAKENLSKEVAISDHYLFKKEVLSLGPKKSFKKVKIVSLENLGLENRAGYYDSIGALRDMVQSHFFNIVFKLTKNVKKFLNSFEVVHYKRAQYGDGKNRGYIKELGKFSETETFAHVKARFDNRELEFITGKKFSSKSGYIAIDDNVSHFDSSDNSYTRPFEDFLSGNKKNFSSINSSIIGWKLIEIIERKKSELSFYEEGTEIK